MPRPYAALAAAAAATALLLTGCAERQPAAPPEPTETATASLYPAPTDPATPGPLVRATPAPTLSGAPTTGRVQLTVHRSVPPLGVRRGPVWEVLKADPSASSVEIAWTDTPIVKCGAVRDAYVRETSDTVIIVLARSEQKTDIVCPMVLVPRRTTLPLDAPLGTRTLEEEASATCPSRAPVSQSSDIICPQTTSG